MTISELIHLLQKLEVILGDDDDHNVLVEGNHFTLTAPKAMARLPPPSKRGPPNGPNGGKQVMNTAKDPSIWPYENGTRSHSPRARAIQKIMKEHLIKNGSETKSGLRKRVKKGISARIERPKDGKGRHLWVNTFEAILRNYTGAGYLSQSKDNEGNFSYSLRK